MSEFPKKTLTTAIEDTRIKDIPLAENDKGDVIGWTGTEWKKADEIAQHPSGRKAYRFGDRWQMGPEPRPGLNTVRLAGTAAVQGVTDVLRLPAQLHELGMSGMDWLMRKTGIVSDTPEAIARRREPNPLVPSVTKAVESVGLPTDPRAEAQRLAADWTPNREAITSGVRTATGTAAMGAPAGIALLSGVGAGLGNRVGGEAGELAGSFMAPGFVSMARSGARKNFVKSAPIAETPQSASQRLAQTMIDTYRAEKAMVTPEIEAAKAAVHATNMPTNVVKGFSDKYLASIGPVKASQIPTSILEKAFEGGKTVSFQEVDNALSIIKATARDLPRGDPRRLAIEEYVRHMSNLAPYKKPGVAAAYSQYRQFKDEFGDRNFGQIFQRDKSGRPMVPPSEMGETVANLSDEAIAALKRYPGIRQAIDSYEKARGISKVQDAIYNAGTRSSMRDLALRNEFAALARDKRFMATLSEPERKAVMSMVEPPASRKLARALGYAPYFFPAYGDAANRVTGAIAERNARLVEAILRHGAPPKGLAASPALTPYLYPMAAQGAQQ